MLARSAARVRFAAICALIVAALFVERTFRLIILLNPFLSWVSRRDSRHPPFSARWTKHHPHAHQRVILRSYHRSASTRARVGPENPNEIPTMLPLRYIYTAARSSSSVKTFSWPLSNTAS